MCRWFVCPVAIVAMLGLFASGCGSQPARVRPAALDADKAGDAAVKAYDTNGDSRLSEDEFKACPAIAQALAQYDTDGDKHVSAQEIAARIVKWQQLKVGLMGFSCRVTWAGRPLSAPRCGLVPETFLGDVLPAASGTTNEDGRASPAIPAEAQPDPNRVLSGMYPGLYKVEITHPDIPLPPRAITANRCSANRSPPTIPRSRRSSTP